jgi:GT2 family glycosyltransferase
MSPSSSHLVLIPAYNPGPRLVATVVEALRQWRPVLVVIDGSTDGSHRPLAELVNRESGLSVLALPRNRGKGAAVLAGLHHAVAQGYTHALVMDADGQHPAASIAEFMAASQRQPAAMILGRPIFGPDIPVERLYGRKLSTALVHLETLGCAVADPLCGFRVYPARALLQVLGTRRGGRRYDFDTEAAVRLYWAGVPAVNLPAPVRYFRREEGGVSHYRYGRDNLRLAWMHTRLITELLVRRLPARLGRLRLTAGLQAALLAAAGLGALLAGRLAAAAPDEASVIQPGLRLNVTPPDPGWRDLFTDIRRRATVEAPFEEHRWFPFHKKPVVLTGEVRIDAARGLSLHYEQPQERTVIIDDRGIVIRERGRDSSPPADPRARLADSALLDVLRFAFTALADRFELYGVRDGPRWTLALVPRVAEIRRTLGNILVEGEGDRVRRIQLRRSATERVDILVDEPKPEAPFSAEELRRYFR